MNQLEMYLKLTGTDEVKAMNLLQEHGIVSDNCVSASDVVDTGTAISWLNYNYKYKITT